MFSEETKKKIRQIKIYTRRLLSGTLVGDYSTATKGSGFEFDQLRDYQVGDDIRFIDWNASARMNRMMVRQYLEERNRTIIIAMDTSASTAYSSGPELISERIAQVGSVLAIAGDYGKDHVALVSFSEEAKLEIPPGNGTSHVERLMEKLFTLAGSGGKTDLDRSLRGIAAMHYKDPVIFVLSDFVSDGFGRILKVLSRQCEVICVRFLDPLLTFLPASGFMKFTDPETGEGVELDVSGNRRERVVEALQKRRSEQDRLFKRARVDLLDIPTEGSFVGEVIRFFKRRMVY